MTDSPRWEREASESLRPSAPQPEETSEFDMAAAGLVDPGDLSDPPEYAHDPSATGDELDEWAEPESRLAGVRETLHSSLSATRRAARESLSSTRDSLSVTGDTVASTAGRVGRWFAALDRRPEYGSHLRRDPIAELTAGEPETAAAAELPAVPPPATPEPEGRDSESEPEPGRFPTAPLGYNRHAVDSHVAALEAELEQLRAAADPPPPSINDELERLGERTSSILVTAHDKAHETTRQAEAQAARALSDATRDAERVTAEAERRLHELDEETDAVWRERERLLDDVRAVSRTLITLADEATERFPAAETRTPEPDTESAKAG